jgi:hypothetical protein
MHQRSHADSCAAPWLQVPFGFSQGLLAIPEAALAHGSDPLLRALLLRQAAEQQVGEGHSSGRSGRSGSDHFDLTALVEKKEGESRIGAQS